MVVLKHFPWACAALAAAIGIGVPSTGHAAFVTETFTDPYSVPSATGIFTQNLNFQQFDSNLGQLQSITIELAGSGYTILTLYNFTGAPVAYTDASTKGSIQVSALGLTSLLANLATGTPPGTPLSGTVLPGITSITSDTQTFDIKGGIGQDTFLAYTGNGSAAVVLTVGPFPEAATFLASPTASGGSGSVAGNVSVTYSYDDSFAAVPEPSTLAVFGTGIFLLGFMRRQKVAAGGANDLLPPGAAA